MEAIPRQPMTITAVTNAPFTHALHFSHMKWAYHCGAVWVGASLKASDLGKHVAVGPSLIRALSGPTGRQFFPQ
jgi:hypothetical protein